MKKKSYYFAIALFISSSAFAEDLQPYWGSSTKALSGNLKLAERILPPKKIQEEFPKHEMKVFSIDLDQDGKADYIITFDSIPKTCFVDSTFKIRSCEARGKGDGFVYYYFAQLDNDPMLELFEFEGDEDYSDYKLVKLDPKTWKTSVLFNIKPWIITMQNQNKQVVWGYPWDIEDIAVKEKNDNILVPVNLTEMDFDIEMDTDFKKYRNIFFTGTPSQHFPPKNPDIALNNLQYLLLKQITPQIIKK